jgi:hypothetical protein
MGKVLPFGIVPKEVPVQTSLLLLAPLMRDAVIAFLADPVVAQGRPERPFETLRTMERQTFLYGFSRLYDDSRGRVTNAVDIYKTWHGYGLAIDIIEKDATPWEAPADFWSTLAQRAPLYGLTSGALWSTPDLPHIQWAACPKSPTPADKAMLIELGPLAVQQYYKAA